MKIVVELADSASGLTVAVLDSFHVTRDTTMISYERQKDLDLLSGTYFVRLRVDTIAMMIDSVVEDGAYHVATLLSRVENEQLARVRRVVGEHGTARVTAYPNPVNERTEIRFSVPQRSPVTLALYNQAGEEVTRLVDGEPMEVGRYALDLDASDLPAGTYLVDLRYGTRRTVERMVVIR